MRLARGNRDRPVVADAVTAVVVVVDTVAVAKVASEEATKKFRIRDREGAWAGLDSNQRRRKASRFTVCPVWPLRYLPVRVRAIHIGSRCAACKCHATRTVSYKTPRSHRPRIAGIREKFRGKWVARASRA